MCRAAPRLPDKAGPPAATPTPDRPLPVPVRHCCHAGGPRLLMTTPPPQAYPSSVWTQGARGPSGTVLLRKVSMSTCTTCITLESQIRRAIAGRS